MMNLLIKFLISWVVDINRPSWSPHPLAGRRWRDRALPVVLLVLGAFTAAQPAQAEGSRDLTALGGDRAYLEFRNDFTSGIRRRTLIRVFANGGEFINLGSSALGFSGATIAYRSPNGVEGTCDTDGLIANREEEAAGPGAAGGFTPCVVAVPNGETGIWEIDFQSPDPDSVVNPPRIAATGNWTQANNVGWVAAWDATVSSGAALGDGGIAIPGRVFTNYLALNLGTFDAALNTQVFFLTEDGYEYRFRAPNLQPFGFIFFANSDGFIDAEGNPLYRSVNAPQAQPAPIRDRENLGRSDTVEKLFFNRPDPTLPPFANSPSGFTWLRNSPTLPPAANNFAFAGIEGTPGAAGNNPLGGNFTFDSTVAGTASIVINFGNPAIPNRVLFSPVTVGANTLAWDGTDGAGNPAPVGDVAYNATLRISAGEIHFPLLDAENNPGGLEIERLTFPNIDSDPFTIYYDNRSFTTNLAGAPTPIQALEGISSQGGGHRFGASGALPGFGDERGIDTWTLIPSRPVLLEGGFLVRAADLTIEKTGTISGNTVTFTVTVGNNPIPPQLGGSSNVTGAVFTDTIPEAVTNVTWTCVASTGSQCTPNGSGNTINDTVDLLVGGTVTYTVTGTVTPALDATEITNTATIRRPDDVTDPIDNDGSVAAGDRFNRTESDSVALIIPPVGPILGVAKQRGTIVNNGDGTFTVPFTVLVENLGSEGVNNVQLVENLFGSPDSAFNGAEALSVIVPPTIVSGPLTATNPNFNGQGDRNLLAGNQSLGVGERATLTFTIQVTPGAQTGPFNNNVVGTGTDANGNLVTDTSTDQTGVPNPTSDPDNDGNPNNNTVPTATNFRLAPNLRLVKRITGILRNGVPVAGIDTNSFINDSEGANALNLAGLTPVGVLSIPPNVRLQSGDQVEYTFYFLSDGSSPVLNARLCDQIPVNSDFLLNGYAPGRGIQYRSADNPTPINLTNAADTDAGRYFTPLAPLPPVCGPNQNNGAVVVDLGEIPVNGTGLVRFRTQLP